MTKGLHVTAVVTQQDSGYLLCEEHGTYWCGEIEKACRDGVDLDWYFKDNISPNNGHNFQIMVPMIPTQNLWTEVDCEQIKLPGDTWALQCCALELPDIEDVGMIMAGEGRLTLRSLILDQFWGTINPDELKCEAGSHGYKQSMRLQQHKKEGGSNWTAELWAMFVEQKCLSCISQQDVDLSQYVPDVGEQRSWNSTGSNRFF